MVLPASTPANFNDWHRCNRYWANNVECPFKDEEEHEDDDDTDDDEKPRGHPIPPASEPRMPVGVPIPIARPNRRPVPILVGKDDTLDDGHNADTIKEVIRFPDLRNNPFTDRPQEPIPLPDAAIRRIPGGEDPRRSRRQRATGPGPTSPLFSPLIPPPITPTPAPSLSPSPRTTLSKAQVLETLYAEELARRSSPSPATSPIPSGIPTTQAKPTRLEIPTPPLRDSRAPLAALVQLRNSSLWTSGQAAGGLPPIYFPPHGISPSDWQRAARASFLTRQADRRRATSDRQRRSREEESPQLPFPPIFPPLRTPGGGGFNFNFSAHLRAILGRGGPLFN